MDHKIANTIAVIFPVWEQLTADARTDLLAQGQYVNLSADEFICMEGDSCNYLPLIISGSARVYKIGTSGREITLYHLERGDSCIMTASCIISRKVFPAFAIAETELQAFIIPANTLREWVQHNSIWQEYIFGLLAQRLANVIETVEEVAFERLDRRIASFLLNNCDREAYPKGNRALKDTATHKAYPKGNRALKEDATKGFLKDTATHMPACVEADSSPQVVRDTATHKAYPKENRNSPTIKITHEAIAQELGSSREVISRILKTWEKQGLLSLSRGKIELKNCLELENIKQLDH